MTKDKDYATDDDIVAARFPYTYGERNQLRCSGVYKMTNILTGEFYVGSSFDIWERWRSHIYDLVGGRHHSKLMTQSFHQSGAENPMDVFKIEILQKSASLHLRKLEGEWIRKLKPSLNKVGATVKQRGDLATRFKPKPDERWTDRTLDTLAGVVSLQAGNSQELRGIVTNVADNLNLLIEEGRRDREIMRQMQADIRQMQIDVRGLQTENRRILEHLEQHQSDGHGA
jgi:hypothetical protein